MRIYCGHDSSDIIKSNRGYFPCNKKDATDLNREGFGVFFSVHDFTDLRQSQYLKKLNAWFIDTDHKPKPHVMKQLEIFMTPTKVVESKNGYHAYWECREDILATQNGLVMYENILRRLVYYFDSDKNAMKITQILRLPGFYHMKNPNEPFKVKEVFSSNKTYTLKQMDLALPVIPKPEAKIKANGDVQGDDFWERAGRIGCTYALSCLSGANELACDAITFKDVRNKKHLIINGKNRSGCWIDENDQIGSVSNGGPTIIQWIEWYGHDKAKVAEILKKYIPELNQDLSCFNGATWT